MSLADIAQWVGIGIGIIGAYFAIRREWKDHPNLKIFVKEASRFYALADPLRTECALFLAISNLSTSANSVLRFEVTTRHLGGAVKAKISQFGENPLPINIAGKTTIGDIHLVATWQFGHESDTLPIQIIALDSSGKSYRRSITLNRR